MIVYNVKRRWFAMKGDAERYRIREKLAPDATSKLSIEDRAELAAFLDALCQAPAVSAEGKTEVAVVPERIIDDSFVDSDFDIPKFLRDSWARLRSGGGEQR